MKIFYFTLFILGMLFTVPFALLVFRLTRLVFKRPVYTAVEFTEVPEKFLKRFALAGPFLESLGFSGRRALRYTSILQLPEERHEYAMEYTHPDPDKGVVATVFCPLPSAPFHVAFTSCFEEGSGKKSETWITLNGLLHFFPSVPKNPRLFDDYLADPCAAWQAHCQRVDEHRACSLQERNAPRDRGEKQTEEIVEEIVMEEIIDDLVRQKILKPATHEGHWRMTWRGAFRWGIRFLSGARKARRIASFTKDRTWRAQAEADAFKQNRKLLRAMALSPRDKRILSAFSALLFLLLLAWLTDWTFAFIVFGCVALHEGGHGLAMKLMGFRNLMIFLIPGLGGAAMGEKRGVTPFERMTILLAGPMPGLILTLGIWVVMGELFPTAFMKMSFSLYFGLVLIFFINYLNLLPIYPLDGGRIMDLLFFSRFPKSRFYFVGFCCVILSIISLMSGHPELICLSGVFAGGMPFQWRLMRGRLLLKEHLGASLSKDPARSRVFQALQAPYFDRVSSNLRLQIGEILISDCTNRRLSRKEFWVGAVVYILCLYLSISIGLAYGDGLHWAFQQLFRR